MTEAALTSGFVEPGPVTALRALFGDDCVTQQTADDIPTLWVDKSQVVDVLRHLKHEEHFELLYDLSAIDERTRQFRDGQPDSDFTVFYHLISLRHDCDIRIKAALPERAASLPTVTSVYPVADWYEREAYDMFGIDFAGHPNLRRILTPPNWEGHPLRKEHPARATEMDPFTMTPEFQESQQEALRFVPEEWGMSRGARHTDFMFLNLGPNHPSVHGVFRIALQLDGEIIVQAVPDIGYHHRAQEKMAERQSWHTYIPYTDRVDYLGGVMNNLPYVMNVEKMAGIVVPERAQFIRVMLCEFFRIASHLLFYGTYAQDIGQMSPVFYMFADRERLFSIIEAITGGRMHPSWFRIGGVTEDLPEGWDRMVLDFVQYLPKRMDHYEKMALKNRILQKRSIGIGTYTTEEGPRLGHHRPVPARHRPRLGPAQEAPLQRLRPARLRHSDRAERRRLRPGRGTRRGDPPEPAHHRTVRAQHALRPVQGGSSPHHAAGEGAHDGGHRDAHPPLPERELGSGDQTVRVVDDDRGHQGLELLLLDLRRRHDGLPHAPADPLVPRATDDPADQQRLHGGGSHRHHREHRLRHGGRGPMSEAAPLEPIEQLSVEELALIEAECAHLPDRQSAAIDAMMIVQKHRGWVSDASLSAIARVLDDAGRHARLHRHVLQPHLPPARRAARRDGLRQRELLHHGGRRPRQGHRGPSRHPLRRDDRRTTASRCCPSSASAPVTRRRRC